MNIHDPITLWGHVYRLNFNEIMKFRFIRLGIFAVIVFSVSIFFVACNDVTNGVVKYHGQVVYLNTTMPFPDLLVKVTDGQDTHCQTQSDIEGHFILKVRVDEIDDSYYLLAGDSSCVPKKVALWGYGQAEVDLGVIEVEGPTLPTVKTTSLAEVTADAAILGGEVLTDGRLAVTARGICYSTEQHPTADGLYTTDGSGLGEFSSELKNLEHNTIYYARAYATNRIGTAYGEQVKFTTEMGVPIVITDSVYRVSAHGAKCKSHVESDGGYSISKKGTCWSKYPDPTIDDDCTNDGSGIGEFTSTLSDLVENTTYYIRSYATNETATVYGEQLIITTLDGLAVVTTDSITEVTATSLIAYGTVVTDCDIPVTARGFCYATTRYPTLDDEFVSIGNGLGTYQGNLKNLHGSMTYYVRAYATNAIGTTYGEQLEITTPSGLPTVITSETIATSTKISSGGNVTSDGGYTITARGVCYSTFNSNPTIEDSFTTSGKGLGGFTSIITEVSVNTTYYICAYASNSNGTAYGKVITVTTGDGSPMIKTTPVGENVYGETPEFYAVSGGQVIDDGGYTVTARGVCWNTLPYPTIDNDKTIDGSGLGYFSSTISNITFTDGGKETYYVRAYATNEKGTAYGQQVLISHENFDYKNLPLIEYAGYVYRIYNDIGKMNWENANKACEELVYGGYDDWTLPNSDELNHIMTNYKYGWYQYDGRNFVFVPYSAKKNDANSSAKYWTNETSGNGYHDTWYYKYEDYYDKKWYSYNKNTPTLSEEKDGSLHRVRPVRKYLKNQ